MTVYLKSPSYLPLSGGQPSHRDLVREMMRFAVPDTKKGLALFTVDMLLYCGALAGVLYLPGTGWKLLAAVLAGVKLANLVTLAHDAAHNTLTASRRLNWWLGVFAFMPALFNYRLWVYDHHALHHPHTNGDVVDSYQPLSKAAYDALPAWRQAWHRFTRSGNPLSFGLYYIVQRWSQVKFVPGEFLPAAQRKSAWLHFGFLLTYFTAYVAFLCAAPSFAPVSTAEALLLGFAVPFFVFQSLLASALYINHTHPDIPWTAHGDPYAAELAPEAITLHLRFPHWFAVLSHHFYAHTAHHIYPGVPCYRLGQAQARLDQLLGARALVMDFSLGAMKDIFKRCKLYDYRLHRWTDYDGVPTTQVSRAILELHYKPVIA